MSASTLEQFLDAERPNMLRCLKGIVRELKRDIKRDRELYQDGEHEEPSIDIRLCVDRPKELSDRSWPPERWTWDYKTGSSDYDTYHSDYCGASCVGLETESDELLRELIEQIGE